MKKAVTLLLLLITTLCAQGVEISDQDALRIGKKIWINECAGTVEGLTSWNKGEDFPSLGIGHFIWYREGQEKIEPFEQSFPKLVVYLREQNIAVPAWLHGAAPWKNREEFFKEIHGERLTQLRKLLKDTVPHQARFMAIRLHQSLPKMIENLPQEEQDRIQRNFNRLLQNAQGVYALMDYVNFKGEGVSPKERYQGKGWGLLQVLTEMDDQTPSANDAFADAAIHVLTRRIKLAPKDESRWLAGWTNRANTYR